jgi:branched-chain amino acid transport system permease protein
LLPPCWRAGWCLPLSGLLLAIPSLRIKGLYLAMATLAFHFLAIFVVREIQRGQVGSSGFRMPRAALFGVEIHGLRAWYIFLVVFLGLSLLFTRTLLVRKPGRAWRAIRGGPALASMSGVSIWRYKIWAFVVSSFLIGVAGAVLGYYTGSVSYETFTLHMAIVYLAYVIIGGMGSIYGPVVGAFFLFLLPTFVEWLRDVLSLERVISSSEIFFVQGAMIGLAIVVMILVEPLGLAALARRAAQGVASSARGLSTRLRGEGRPL